jgi:hypothetical protein
VNKVKFKKIIVPIVVLGLSVLAGGFLVKQARADDLNYGRGRMIEQLSERFNLNEDEVNQAVDEFRQERQNEMQARHEERLQEAVEDGVITEEQKQALLNKHEEMRQEREKKWAEMRDWMEESGIDFQALKEYGVGQVGLGCGGGRSGRMGFGRMKVI